MQQLILAEDIFDQLETGKRTTIRKGRRSINLDELEFESLTEKRKAVYYARMVYYCKLKDVLESDLINDGFENHADLLDKMKRFYPDLTDETELTVIRFK